MTSKQEKFVNKYLETGNATEAAMQVYKPQKRATARAIGSENLTKPSIRRTIQEALNSRGLSNDFLISKVAELISAKKRITILKRGEVGAVREEIDTAAVKAGLEFAFKLKAGEIQYANEMAFKWQDDKPNFEISNDKKIKILKRAVTKLVGNIGA